MSNLRADVEFTRLPGQAWKRENTVGKQEHFRALVQHGTSRLRFKYVLGDSWFACADNRKLIVKDCERDFIMALKENRKLALSKEDKLSGQYISIKEAVSEGCVRSVYIEQLDFP